jgi:hypothetical protein
MLATCCPNENHNFINTWSVEEISESSDALNDWLQRYSVIGIWSRESEVGNWESGGRGEIAHDHDYAGHTSRCAKLPLAKLRLNLG